MTVQSECCILACFNIMLKLFLIVFLSFNMYFLCLFLSFSVFRLQCHNFAFINQHLYFIIFHTHLFYTWFQLLFVFNMHQPSSNIYAVARSIITGSQERGNHRGWKRRLFMKINIIIWPCIVLFNLFSTFNEWSEFYQIN